MPITLTQTDTAGAFAVGTYCGSARGTFTTPAQKLATSGGTAGTGTNSVTHAAAANNQYAWTFTSAAGEPNNTSWESGNWTVRIEITTANANFSAWDALCCRVDSGGTSQGTVFTNTAGVGDISTTGVKSVTVAGAAQAGASATDRILVEIGINSTSSMTQSCSFKPSQNIDTPVTQNGGAVFIARPAPIVRQAITRASYW
jgi:hypothetical protein